ncbi:protein cueball-like isoform X2 [Artemia franciscana]|uniref:protein cueball-like isoform X2 n=1 Tax=Artemia franciscana TaxID=6661 RepID=UPI0032DA2EAA
MKYKCFSFCFLIIYLFAGHGCQDILISLGSKLQIHHQNETSGIPNGQPFTAYDHDPDVKPSLKAVALSDSGVFFSSTVDHQSSLHYIPLSNNQLKGSDTQNLLSARNCSIEGLCYIQPELTLIWTDSTSRSIHKASIASGWSLFDDSHVLIELGKEDLPKSIVYDHCSNRLFWTNWNFESPSIESAFTNGSGRIDVVRDALYQPHGLTIFGNRLYFTNAKPGYTYDIESVTTDGSNRQVHVKGHDQYPIQLAVTRSHIFWSDQRSSSVWYISNDVSTTQTPKLFVYGGNYAPYAISIVHPEYVYCNKPSSEEPIAMVDNPVMQLKDTSSDQCNGYCLHGFCKILNGLVKYCDCELGYKGSRCEVEICPSGYCLNTGTCQSRGDKPYCVCPPGFTGSKCEINQCYQFCHNGICAIRNNKPTCSCNLGYAGDRCERNICKDHCFNNGVCSVSVEGPQCSCGEEYAGERCQYGVCDHFCLNGGMCSVVNRTSVCLCQDGWSGSRCEKRVLDSRSVCKSYCFNGGSCIATEDGGPICSCANDFTGLRCEVSLSLLSSNEGLLVPLISSCVLGFILLLAVAFLAFQVWRLRKRPRLRKHYVVNKPTSNGLHGGSDGIHLELENCCNMNVCETITAKMPLR